ncbi:MAG: glutamate--tRNA ligase, partial [Gemmatimonadetes bacterium]|nr:glutamate--tRNA ligase [Gemmatimonadota bacterium]
EAFRLEGIQGKPAIFDVKKLEWMNGQHLSRTPPERLVALIAPLLPAHGLDPATVDPTRMLQAIQVVRARSRTTLEVAKQVAVRLDGRQVQRDEKAEQLIAKDPETFRKALSAAEQRLAALSDAEWQPQRLEAELRALAESLGVAAGKVFQPIRVALTGGTVSEPVHDLVWAVGKPGTIARLRAAQQSS